MPSTVWPDILRVFCRVDHWTLSTARKVRLWHEPDMPGRAEDVGS